MIIIYHRGEFEIYLSQSRSVIYVRWKNVLFSLIFLIIIESNHYLNKILILLKFYFYLRKKILQTILFKRSPIISWLWLVRFEQKLSYIEGERGEERDAIDSNSKIHRLVYKLNFPREKSSHLILTCVHRITTCERYRNIVNNFF